MSFSPSGNLLVVGHVNGSCVLYETATLKLTYMTQIDCKNRQGKYATGRKVAGITFLNDVEFLVATNDSSVRLYSAEDKEQKVKFKGHFNDHLQMTPSVDIAR